MSTGGSLADVVSSLGAGAGMEEQGILPPPPVVQPTAEEKLRALPPQLFGTMGQMQGDKIDPNAVMGGLAALLGSDEFARRGMVAQGNPRREWRRERSIVCSYAQPRQWACPLVRFTIAVILVQL